MDPCSYYEGVSADGISFCELFGNCCADEEGFTAQTACCVCGEYLVYHKLLLTYVTLYFYCGDFIVIFCVFEFYYVLKCLMVLLI